MNFELLLCSFWAGILKVLIIEVFKLSFGVNFDPTKGGKYSSAKTVIGTLTSGKVFWMVLVSLTLLMALLAVVVVEVNFDEDEAMTTLQHLLLFVVCYLN